MISVKEVNLNESSCIEYHLSECEECTVHYTPQYLSFLQGILPEAKIFYLVAFDLNEPVGLIPIAALHVVNVGWVINSLPFFGSHGGVVVFGESINSSLVATKLLQELMNYSKSVQACSVTIVENLFVPMDKSVCEKMQLKAVDYRIGQITYLPRVNATSVDDKLFSLIHSKTRNAIRKGLSRKQLIKQCDDDESWAWVQSVHEKSIRSLGGVPKSMNTFNMLRKFLGKRVRLYVGVADRVRVSGLVVILNSDTVEYFTPVVEEDERSTQALSATIFTVMKELALEGYRLWNWGGTWASQKGVYRFKSRWGAEDQVYSYYNFVSDIHFLEKNKEDIINSFAHFYLFRY